MQASAFRAPIALYNSVGGSPSGTFALDLNLGSAAEIFTPTGSGVLTVAVTNCLGTTYAQEFSFSVHQTANNYTTVTVTCDAGISVHFASGTLDNNLSSATATDVYIGKIIGSFCYMSVQRFPGV